MPKLRVLDLSANRLTVLECVDHLTALTDLWLNDNRLPSLDGLEEKLKG